MSKAPQGRSLLHWLNGKRRRRRRRRGDADASPRSLEEVLGRVEPTMLQAQRQRCPVTHEQWQQAAGMRIANRSIPKRLENTGTLLVTVTSSVWAQELSLLAPSLCARLRGFGHAVTSLRFAVGQVTPPRRGPERFESREVPAPEPIPGDLQQELEEIEDDDLREAIAAAASSSLAVLKHSPK